MKWSVLSLMLAIAAWGQQNARVVEYDGLGHAMPGPSYTASVAGSATSRTESRQSLNGRMVPVESVEERVVSDDGARKVMERVVRRYDASGNAIAPEKLVIEMEKRGGGVTTRTSTFRGDFNGNMALAERTTQESRTSGNLTETTEVVDKPTINGEVQTAERRVTAVRVNGDDSVKNTVVYQRNENGQFDAVLKQSGEVRKTTAGVVENTSTYENYGGAFRLQSQTVRTTTKGPGGDEVREDVYRANVPGVATEAGSTKPQLVEQRLTTRQASGNVVKETVDVRRATVSSPDRLGAPTRQSERICTGKCD